MYVYWARLIAVVDGDTVHADIDCGLDIGVRKTVRLYGVDAPPKSTPEGAAAAAYAAEWFAGHCPDGRFELRTHKERREKYGRYLGVITSGGRVLNSDLLADGHGVPYAVG